MTEDMKRSLRTTQRNMLRWMVGSERRRVRSTERDEEATSSNEGDDANRKPTSESRVEEEGVE